MNEEPKLITLDNLKNFADKCKQTFSPNPYILEALNNYNYLYISLNGNYDNIKKICFNIQGVSDKSKYLYSNIFIDKSNDLFGVVYNVGEIFITSGFIYKLDENYTILIIKFEDFIPTFLFDIKIKINDSWVYNDINKYKFDFDFDKSELSKDYIEFPSEKIQVYNGNFNFSIINANDESIPYSLDKEFNSIKYAKCLNTNKTFELQGFVTGKTESDLSENIIINTKLNQNDKNLKNIIDTSVSNNLGDWKNSNSALATEFQSGLIKLGNNPSNSVLNLKSDAKYGGYIELPNNKLPYLKQADILPEISNDYTSEQIVQYTGELCEKYIPGKLYRAQINTISTTEYEILFRFSSGKIINKTILESEIRNYPWNIILEISQKYPGIKVQFNKNSENEWVDNINKIYSFTNENLLTMLNKELTEDDLNNSENVIINIINSELKKINNINWVSIKIPKYALSSTEININYDSPEYIYLNPSNPRQITSFNISSAENFNGVKVIKLLIYNTLSASVIIPSLNKSENLTLIEMGTQKFFNDLTANNCVELTFTYWDFNLVLMQTTYKYSM